MPPPSFTVLCDECNGRKFVGGRLCAKCNGNGTMEVPDVPLTFSQATAKRAGRIVFLAVLVAIAIIAALHYFGAI